MATLRKRGNKFCVIYYGIKKDGSYGQIWESFEDKVAAEIRKDEVELEKKKAALIGKTEKLPTIENVNNTKAEQSPRNSSSTTNILFSDLAKRWFDIYPVNNWAFSMYDLAKTLCKTHIYPYFGEKYIQDITPMDIEEFMAQLKMTKVKGVKAYNKNEDEIPCLSSSTRRSTYLVIKQIFDKAVEWNYLSESPVKIRAPKKTCKSRDIWDVNTMQSALDNIKHPLLHLGVHLSFVCTLRIGECCGLTWDCIDFTSGKIHVGKTMLRISKSALDKLPKEDAFYIYPEKLKDSKSVLVLKKPKTDGSERILYMTEPLKNELLKRKTQYDKTKLYMGTDFIDYNLVFSLDNGTPIEPHLLEKWFKKWQDNTTVTLPTTIDFHSIRHSSTTYKLQISGGDIKSVQGDTGHSSADMVVNTYAHMQDNNRRFLMQTLENSFYPQTHSTSNLADINKMFQSLDPELKKQLLALISDNAEIL